MGRAIDYGVAGPTEMQNGVNENPDGNSDYVRGPGARFFKSKKNRGRRSWECYAKDSSHTLGARPLKKMGGGRGAIARHLDEDGQALDGGGGMGLLGDGPLAR